MDRSVPARPVIGLLAVLLLAGACRSASPTPSPNGTDGPSAAPSATASGAAVDLAASADLRDAVDAAGIREHLDELLAIAAANDGSRAAGTAGYDQSVAYVADVLTDAGYEVTVDEFTFPAFLETAPAELAVSGGPTFVGGDHLHALIFSPSGDITAPVAAVALAEDGSTTGRAGCDGDDWDGFPEGAIALVGPGGCFTRQKVDQAITAGAAALIAANPAWPAGQVRRPTLLFPEGVDIPALAASAEVGEALLAAAHEGASAHLVVSTLNENRVTANVIAERPGDGPGSSAEEVVMLGGHLDSVLDGPGINDNGSGTMTILEIAQALAEGEPTARTVRFAFWSAEELGLYGSRSWVERQSDEELERIVAYLNFDMVASPNYGRFVYDSSAAVAVSRDITDAFGAYFDAMGLGWEGLDISGATDSAPFDDALVPTGGLFTGATELKSADQSELFGGSADEPMSPCYHLACDTLAEVNLTALDELSDAAAHVLLWLLTAD